ncbi:hypothetical protein Syun_028444 [Stephania yunnanensis]|uniref:Uncharacterized protein n=1 Tax=Stephania yunnanensis TaxID=152371 RepID=A0AAP0EPR1_9MAGN
MEKLHRKYKYSQVVASSLMLLEILQQPIKDLKNNNPKCESATSKRLGNSAAAYPKGSFGDTKSLQPMTMLSLKLQVGERVDPLKVKQEERERFEKKQREEKARIDAHVKVAKEEVALKLLRQKQAARLALEESLQRKQAIVKDIMNESIRVSTSVECLKTCEGQLSPSKSLHAAMSKSRFADTILKAQQKTLSTVSVHDLMCFIVILLLNLAYKLMS